MSQSVRRPSQRGMYDQRAYDDAYQKPRTRATRAARDPFADPYAAQPQYEVAPMPRRNQRPDVAPYGADVFGQRVQDDRTGRAPRAVAQNAHAARTYAQAPMGATRQAPQRSATYVSPSRGVDYVYPDEMQGHAGNRRGNGGAGGGDVNVKRHPRAGLGYYEPGHYCFIVVDGRQKGYSVGVTSEGFAQIFQDLGCQVAYNLDGGATAVMYFNGQIVNKPTKGGRNSSDIILLKEVKQP